MGDTSATGVCFSRGAGNGEDLFNGEYLINAQGEDVVAGIRTPQQITKIGSQRWAERAGISEEERIAKYPSMEEAMPEIYKQLDAIQEKLEDHYRDMQDMEFTVQEGKLWFLQTRNGKRTGAAMVKIAIDLLHQGMIDEKTALNRIEPNKLDELLHPVFDKKAEKQAKVWVKVCRLHRVPLPDRSYSSLMMPLNGMPMAKRLSWSVLRLLRKTWPVWLSPKVSLPLVEV